MLYSSPTSGLVGIVFVRKKVCSGEIEETPDRQNYCSGRLEEALNRQNSVLEGSRRRWIVKKLSWKLPESVGPTKTVSRKVLGGFGSRKNNGSKGPRNAQDVPGRNGRVQTLRL